MNGRLLQFLASAGMYRAGGESVFLLSGDDDDGDDDRRGSHLVLRESIEATCIRKALQQYERGDWPETPDSEWLNAGAWPKDMAAAAARMKTLLARDLRMRPDLERALGEVLASAGRRMVKIVEVGRARETDGADLLTGDLASLLHLTDDHRERLVTAGSLPLRLVQTLFRDPQILYRVSPRKFEEIIAELIAGLGFRDVVLTSTTKDGGRDILACQVFAGIQVRFYFECKRNAATNLVDVGTVRSLLGVLSHEQRDVNKGVLVTTASFTKDARSLIAAEARLDGKDYGDVLDWMDRVWGSRS